MQQIRLITTDLDGTFLAYGDTPHPDNIKMVEKCHAHGIRVCACSGRPFLAVRGIVQRAGLDAFCVSNNGTSVVNAYTGEIRYRNRFAPDTVRQLVQACRQFDCWTMDVAGQRGMYVCRMDGQIQSQKPERMGQDEWDSMIHFTSLEQMLQAAEDDAERIGFGLNHPQNMCLDAVSQACNAITPVEVTSTDLRFVEVTPAYGTKAEAISVLAGMYGCKPENVLALGDGFNDLHMLLWAGTGVAMGNADDRLKAVADYVTIKNSEGGFAQAIERIVFEGR